MAMRNNKPNNYGQQGRMEHCPDQSFNSSQSGQRSDQDRYRIGSSRASPECTYCGDIGHFVETCYKLIGYPPGHPKNKSNRPKNDRSRGHSANQVSDGQTKDEERFLNSSFTEAQLQQLISILSTKEKEGAKSQANSAVAKPGLSKISSHRWIIGRGATYHIVSSSNLLSGKKSSSLMPILLPSCHRIFPSKFSLLSQRCALCSYIQS